MINKRYLQLFCISLLLLPMFLTPEPISASSTPDPGQKGPFEIGFTTFTLIDNSREADNEFGGRPIPVYLWYPVDPEDINGSSSRAIYPLDAVYHRWPNSTSYNFEKYGFDPAYEEPAPSESKPFPFVVFSPGWGIPGWRNVFVPSRLASHGFVVAVIHHYDDGWLPWEPFAHIATALLNRPKDLSYVVTRVLDRNNSQGDLLFNLVNPDQIAASGHSLGGYAAMALAGGDDEVCDMVWLNPSDIDWFGPPPDSTCVPALPDPRIKAIVSLDGSNQYLKFYELARITVPSMTVNQEWERGGEWTARAHAAIQGHPSYRVDVNDTSHISFSSLCEGWQIIRDLNLGNRKIGPLLDEYCRYPGAIPSLEAQRLTAKYMIAFLKTNLTHETGYQDMLTPGWAITVEHDIEFFVTEKRNPNAVDEIWPDCCYLYFPHQAGSEQEQADRDPASIPPTERFSDRKIH